jgi:DNA-directed RNA polymerase specialized sigma24 family protein
MPFGQWHARTVNTVTPLALQFVTMSAAIARPRTQVLVQQSGVGVLTQEREADTREYGLTETAFARLLEWLDDGSDSRGATYLEMRRRLVAYFDRRGRPAADALADETFNRIARTLYLEGEIATRPPARYCYVIARFVLLEDVRRSRRYVPFEDARRHTSLDTGRVRDASAAAAEGREQRLECLDRCLLRLTPDQRELLVEYYRDAKRQRIDRRRDLAARLGISMNALGIRLSRLRASLETCITACCDSR